MSHPAQRKFCKRVRRLHPSFFNGVIVIDVGSLDINGNNRRWFNTFFYRGIDIVAGRNVDVIGRAHEIIPRLYNDIKSIVYKKFRLKDHENPIDVMISTECLEHDEHWEQTLRAMYDHLRPGGLMLITAAGEGRKEHGTYDHTPSDSPGTNDYYRNITSEMFTSVLPSPLFREYYLTQNNGDIQFYGIKNFSKNF